MEKKEITDYQKEVIKSMASYLGGNKAIVMTGGKFIADYEKMILNFHYKMSKHSNRLEMKYDEGQDLIDLKFLKYRAGKIKEIETIKGLYCDQIQEIFEKKTGLYLTMGNIIFETN